MKIIDLQKYAPIISDDKAGDNILNEIIESLKTDDVISIDMKDIKSMATYSAKQIFGKLYSNLGPEDFFNRIEIRNATDNVKTIIRIGIESVL